MKLAIETYSSFSLRIAILGACVSGARPRELEGVSNMEHGFSPIDLAVVRAYVTFSSSRADRNSNVGQLQFAAFLLVLYA